MHSRNQSVKSSFVKEIIALVILKVILLTLLWFLFFSKPIAEQQARIEFSKVAYGMNDSVISNNENNDEQNRNGVEA